MPLRGLRTRIFMNMAVVLIVAMVLIDLVIVVTDQKQRVQSELERGRLSLLLIQNTLNAVPATQSGPASAAFRNSFLKAARAAGVTCGVFSDTAGNAVYSYGRECRSAELFQPMAQEAAVTGTPGSRFDGAAWAVFWQGPRDLMLSTPIKIDHKDVGGVCVSFDLATVYASLRASQKFLFVYIVLNTIILSAFGFYRISRLYLVPVHRLAQRAEGYREESDMPFSVRKEDNELKVLSNALNRMIVRIADDKKELKDTVHSLKTANIDLRRAQDEVIRAEKLSTVGRLASGVAHEIGNPIGIVLGYLELLKRSDTTDAEKQDYVERSEEEIQRISSTIQHLLNFSRAADGTPESVSAHGILAEVFEMLRVQPILSGIDFSANLTASQDTVFADPSQIKQVLINLVLNAADAVAAKQSAFKGRVVLSSELTTADESTDRLRAASKQSKILTIRCIDNGIGIPEDQIAYVFDPFFTTKGPQKGTGLGLSVSYTIVEGMGGRLDAASTFGEGATFSLHLPLHEVIEPPDPEGIPSRRKACNIQSVENGKIS